LSFQREKRIFHQLKKAEKPWQESERFKKVASKHGKITELLVSASDDRTVYLWDPTNIEKSPQLVCIVVV